MARQVKVEPLTLIILMALGLLLGVIIRFNADRSGPGLGQNKSQVELNPPRVVSDEELESSLKILLEQNRKIEAIKLIRLQRQLGLKDAKDAVEKYALTKTLPKELSQARIQGQ